MVSEWRPEGWSLVKLSDLGEVSRGRSRHRPRYAEHLYGGPYPFIQTGDIKASQGRITEYTQTYSDAGLAQSRLWPAGTLCITIAANIAETGILTFSACFPDSVIGFIPDETKCDVFFIEYVLRYMRERIQHEATGSVQDNINLETLERLRFPIPPLAEQRAIAHILGALDDKIELNRRMNATLEAIARAIFKSWFVDFDPVHAKTRGEQPAGMDAATAALFPDAFEDSELGPIPAGWGVKRFGEISEKPQYGYTASAQDEPVGPKFLRIKDINKTPWIEWATVPYCDLTESDYEKYKLRVGDIVIARMADPGHSAFIEDEIDAVFASYLIRFRSIDATFDRYLQFWLRSDDYWFQVEGAKTGTTRSSLNAQVLSSFRLLLPPEEIATAFSRFVAPLRQMLVQNNAESQTLAALRDALLPKLISGEIRVGDIQSELTA